MTNQTLLGAIRFGAAEPFARPGGRRREMEEITHLNTESFDAALSSTPAPLVVDFWAEWCGPCRSVAPVLGRLAREHPEIKIAKVNVDDEPWLAIEHRVYSIPTLVRFDAGSESARAVGALTYERLLAALKIAPDDRSARLSSRGRSWRRGPRWRRGTRRSGSAA
jgi:thioredoxin 1